MAKFGNRFRNSFSVLGKASANDGFAPVESGRDAVSAQHRVKAATVRGPLLLLLAVALGACAGLPEAFMPSETTAVSSAEPPSTTAASVATTTTAQPVVTAKPTTETTAAPTTEATTSTTEPTTSTTEAPTTTQPAPTAAAPVVAANNAFAYGSGCTPGSDSLPDGSWFGYGTVRTEDGRYFMTFDLVCIWWNNADAQKAAEVFGMTWDQFVAKYEDEHYSGTYIRNDSDKLRAAFFADGANGSCVVDTLPTTGNCDAEESLWGTYDGNDFYGEITVAGGQIVNWKEWFRS